MRVTGTPQRNERLGEVIGGGFTFHVRAQGEDDFRWRLTVQPG